MKRLVLAVALSAGLLACGRNDRNNTATQDSLDRDLQRAQTTDTAPLNDQPTSTTRSGAAPSTRATPSQTAPAPGSTTSRSTRGTVAAGTVVQATLADTISSRTSKVGEHFTATVSEDVKNSSGQTVIPQGSTVNLTVTEIQAAKNKSSGGKLTITVDSLTVNGTNYPVTATVTSLEKSLKGRGVGAGEVAKVGGGAVAGAVLGRVIGGNAKGAVIGGVVGAAVGTGVAVETADRDVVVPAGTPMTITVNQALVIR